MDLCLVLTASVKKESTCVFLYTKKKINKFLYRNPIASFYKSTVRRPCVIEHTDARHHMRLDNCVRTSGELKASKRRDVVQILCRVHGNEPEHFFGAKDLQEPVLHSGRTI